MLKQKHINYIWSSPKTSSVTLNEENDSAENHTLQSNGNYLPSARTRLQGLKQMSAEKLASLKNKIAETRSKISVKQGSYLLSVFSYNFNKNCKIMFNKNK